MTYTTLAAWGTPKRGMIRSLPSHEIPQDAVFDASNVSLRGGRLTARAGLSEFSSTIFNGRPVGAFQYQAEDGTRTPVMVTANRIWGYVSGTWTDLTNTVLTGSANQLARMTILEFSSQTQLFITNGADVPRVWTGTGSVSTVDSTSPKFTDVCTTADRIVGIIPPYKIAWGEALTFSVWPTLNARFAAETSDRVVAIQAFGPLGFLLFKEGSLWLGTFVGGSSATSFILQWRRDCEGPAGPGAVCKADGVWVYMTPSGRIAATDGSSFQWIGEGLQPYLNPETGDATSKIDSTNSPRTVASYDPKHQEVTFWYPRTGDGGECKGMVTVSMPKLDFGLPYFACFPGVTAVPISAAMTMRLSDQQDKILAFSSVASTQKSYTMASGVGDAGVAFDGSWQTGLQAVQGMGQYRMAHLEAYLERLAGYGTVTFKGVTSYALDTPGGTVETTGKSIDLATAAVRSETGRDLRGRYFGMRFNFTSASTPIWLGGRLLGLPLEER